jgi:hypothetical protein
MPSPYPARFLFFIAFVFSVSTTCLRAQPVDVHPVRSGSSSISLNGVWEFAFAAGEKPARPSSTAAIAVPGHWELQGFAEPVYGTKELPAGMGFYRRSFEFLQAGTDSEFFSSSRASYPVSMPD